MGSCSPEKNTSEPVGDKTWALVHLSVAPMRAEARFASEMVSQAIMGTPIKLLEKRGEWYRVQTPDEYTGWMNQTGFTPYSAEKMSDWKSKSERLIVTKVGSRLFAEPKEDALVVSDLVQGAILTLEALTESGYYQAKTPDGAVGYIATSACNSFPKKKIDGMLSAISPAYRVVGSAKQLLGTPYLWGGMSEKAMDCSGFTKTVFFNQGFILARDASQQAQYGDEVGLSDWSNLAVGDLLFFGESKEQITHVAIYIGENRFIHDAGKVKINSLNSSDEDYNEKRHKTLVLAKRVLRYASDGAKDIQSVEQSSWYN